jgi:hypothetical protein
MRAASSPASAGAARPAWRAAALALGAYAAAAALLVGVLAGTSLWYGFFDVSDVGLYAAYARALAAGQRPYLDFLPEYPPLAVWLFRLGGDGADPVAYRWGFALLMLGALGAAAALTGATAARLWPSGRRARVAALAFAGGTLAAGAIVANRFDAAVALALAAALLALAHGRLAAACLALGLGFALKLEPAVLLPLPLLLAERPRRAAAAALAFAAAAAIPFLPYLGTPGLPRLFAYHLARPLQIESVLATPFLAQRLAGGTPGVASSFGSQNFTGPAADTLARASGPLGLALLAVVLAAAWRRRAALRAAPAELPPVALALLLVVLVCGKVLSPQYLVWLLPLAALVVPARPALGGLVLGAVLLTQLEFPGLYWAFVRGATLPTLLVVVRNAVLAAALVAALAAVLRPTPRPAS